jgi:TetR/AcrR family transcriptional regulator, multidrug resistance operon repressor
MFKDWSVRQSAQQKYNLLWRNTFNAILTDPQRMAVIEMLYLPSSLNRENITSFEEQVFLPLSDFYQQEVDKGHLHNWPICALITLSFDSAINLAKAVLQQHLQTDEVLINQVRDASWSVIQKI